MTNNTNVSLKALHNAVAITIDAFGIKTQAEQNAASALDVAIEALVTGTLFNLNIALDVTDKAGRAVIEHIKCKVSDFDKAFLNEQGKAWRAAQSAMRVALLHRLGNIKDEKSAAHDAAYIMLTRALTVAKAVRAEGMKAKLDANGKLALTGGKGDKAKALRETESATGRLDIVKGKVPVKKGADDKGKPVAANSNVVDLDKALRVVAAYATAVASNKETPSNARLSYLKAIIRDVSKAIAELEAE
jgi:hypothetical protein